MHATHLDLTNALGKLALAPNFVDRQRSVICFGFFIVCLSENRIIIFIIVTVHLVVIILFVLFSISFGIPAIPEIHEPNSAAGLERTKVEEVGLR